MESRFSYKTRGGVSIENKPKVYFTCHPEDFNAYFDSICNDILSFQDCAVFYTVDMSSGLDDENALVDLERMNLFVIPVTFRLLSTHNRAMDFDYRFAREKHIPVLPIVMEPGLNELYGRPECFGEIQYLKPDSDDSTEVSYKEKLKKYLESVLISDELAQRIRKAFDAYIFLSYRKKDRKYANDLMKLIHNNPECEDLAIWFDEFLTPGENFRENIEKILNDSKMFALLVTPSLLERNEDGTPNFIMREEYPKAMELGKKVLPAEMVATDKEALQRDYVDIPECSDPNDEEAFNKRLLDSLVGIAVSENNNDPEHNYLIGLAYLNGIDVEVDIERGMRLITKAAEAGLLEAVLKLGIMYGEGNAVNYDREKALYWFKRLYEITSERFGEDHPDTVAALSHLASEFFYTGDYKNAFEYQQKCYEISRSINGEEDTHTLDAMIDLIYFSSYVSDQYEKTIELEEKYYNITCRIYGEDDPNSLNSLSDLAKWYMFAQDYKKAIELQAKCYEATRRVWRDEHPKTLMALSNLASGYYFAGNNKKALELLDECYETGCRVLSEEDHAFVDLLRSLAVTYNFLGYNEKAIELQEKCYKINCRIFGEEHPEAYVLLFPLAGFYRDAGNTKKAIEINEKDYEINCRAWGEDHHFALKSLTSLAYDYRYAEDYKKAIELFEKCYETRRRVWGAEHSETLNSLGELADCYRFAEDYKKAIELQEKRCEITCRVMGEEHPKALEALKDLAYCYKAVEDYNKAIEKLEKCYAIQCRSFGEAYPDTLDTLQKISEWYSDAKNYKKAIELQEHCYDMRCRAFGEEHTKTLAALRHLAICYSAVDDYKKAVVLSEKCYEINHRIYGEKDSQTLHSMQILASTCNSAGDYKKAIALQEKCYEISCRVYGEDHPDTLFSLNHLFDLCEEAGLKGYMRLKPSVRAKLKKKRKNFED